MLVTRDNRIVAGHGRVKAAQKFGMYEVPTIRLEDLSDEQIRAYVIADNKLAENAGWDREILAVELQHLLTLDCADFDVTITGFEIAEIDAVLEGSSGFGEEDEAIEPVSGGQPISEPGDLWLLGKHRILCGNSLQDETYKTLMANRRAAMSFSDPPYNVRIDGNVCGKGKIRHREFQMASGEMSDAVYLDVRYALKLGGKDIAQLSSGEKGALPLVFYLLLDPEEIPIIIDQPEQNLDNESVVKLLVDCIRQARSRRQVVIVTHNPNLAVVCDADQVISCKIDKANGSKVTYECGAIEDQPINEAAVNVLEGTYPAFDNRRKKYHKPLLM